HLCLKF
ncbi:Hypothetical protein EIN_105560, partial [Entamoeba invadens IP1]